MRALGRYRWFALLIVFLPWAAPLAAQASSAPDSWLVVVQGDVATVSGTHVDLEADPHALAFTDRPNRIVRLIKAQHFVEKGWGKGGDFAKDPPNASLIGENGTLAIVEITSASWSDGELGMELNLLDGDLPKPGERTVLTIDETVCCATGLCCD